MNAGEWIGVFAGHVWILSQTDDSILYKSFCMKSHVNNQPVTSAVHSSHGPVCHSDSEKCADHGKLLHDYFQLSVNLQEMYKDWAQRGQCICFLFATLMASLPHNSFLKQALHCLVNSMNAGAMVYVLFCHENCTAISQLIPNSATIISAQIVS